MIGYIDSHGKYHRRSKPAVLEANASQWKGWSHDRQRAEHQWELLQPYDRDGRPNAEFMEAYPEESRNNGMRWEDRA